MITLFHRPKTRSARFIFLLEELAAPYEIKLVTTSTGTDGEVDPANPHPHGKVPAIIKAIATGPYILGERFSAADVLYATTFAMFAQSPMLENPL